MEEALLHSLKDAKKVKCVVWDLDHTLWEGILLEDGEVTPREEIVPIILELDRRGILLSIASKNDYESAKKRLKQLGIWEYFLFPQIHWGPKSQSVLAISEALNIGLDTIMFVDDQPFEREEVQFTHATVRCVDAADYMTILNIPEMNPVFITEDSKQRRLFYMADLDRKEAEESFDGPQEEFLQSLDMRLRIHRATEQDLRRAEELTVRTNQLNTTGYSYSFDELKALIHSEEHLLLMADLKDKYGDYGKIGLALIECTPECRNLKLFLMSCRVMSRGVGSVMLSHIMKLTAIKQVPLQSEFLPNDRNRMMYVTLKFAGFKDKEKRGNIEILEHDLLRIPPFPDYISLQIDDE